MPRKYITNDTDAAKYIGGKLLQPGEGREFDDDTVPPEHASVEVSGAAEEPDADAALRERLTHSVADLKKDLASLSSEDLDRLAVLEGEAGSPRKTLLEAIADEQIHRASEALEQQRDQALHAAAEELYQKQLAELSPEQLAAVHEHVKPKA